MPPTRDDSIGIAAPRRTRDKASALPRRPGCALAIEHLLTSPAGAGIDLSSDAAAISAMVDIITDSTGERELDHGSSARQRPPDGGLRVTRREKDA